MSLIDSKSVLAKLLAAENLTVEQSNVPTASFDVANRILTVPVLDNNISGELYDLFIGHEVGHALWTPLDGLIKGRQSGIIDSISNVVEDARIERKMRVKYPGLRASFIKGYRELFDREFFCPKHKDVNEMNLIDRINLHFKLGVSKNIKFTPDEAKFVQMADETKTYDDVLDVAKQIQEFMREQQKEQLEEALNQAKNDKSNSDDSDDFDNLDHSESDSYENFDGDPQKAREKHIKEKFEDELEAQTDLNFSENQQELFDKKSDKIGYVNIPEFPVDDLTIDFRRLWETYRVSINVIRAQQGASYEWTLFRTNGTPDKKMAAYKKVRTETNKVVSYLTKEFELRKNAEQLKRSSTAKTGDLNMSKIYSYGFNEDLFKKVTVMPNGKSHGLVMFIDWSGSMHTHLNNTVKQLLALTLFCKKVNIPFEVYAFSTEAYKITDFGKKTNPNSETFFRDTNWSPFKQYLKNKDLNINEFGLMNVLSSRMTANEFTFAASELWYIASQYSGASIPLWMRLSSTPMNEAIISAMTIVPEFQKKYKLQIVNTVFLTDGDADHVRGYWLNDPIDNKLKHESFYYLPKLVIRDTKNFREYRSNRKVTSALLSALKVRTGCNIVGFYLLSSREFKREALNKNWTPYYLLNEFGAAFKKNKHAVVKTEGFDEYYILLSDNKVSDDDEDDFEINPTASIKSMSKVFSKYVGGQVSSRVVLNRFIGMIA
jgi:hypothetical protein